jgi:hypothetical protein
MEFMHGVTPEQVTAAPYDSMVCTAENGHAHA